MEPLMSVSALSELLAEAGNPTMAQPRPAGGIVVLDARWRLGGPPGERDYRQAHIPGAVFLDLDSDLAALPQGEGDTFTGRHPLPNPADWQRTLRAAGVGERSVVVAYDDADGSIAARAWWLVRWAGHRAVAVLDGGFAAWQRAELAVSAEMPTPRPGDITVRAPAMPVLDTAAATSLGRAGMLLDARAEQRYTGEVEPADARAGHIPGARNAPFANHVDAHGHWRDRAELAAYFAGLGVRSGARAGAYCGSGVTACSVVLALEVAGLADTEHPAPLYVGSWSSYSAGAGPVALGPQPG
ncbi:MAG: sulfurtransferase [Sciscionella sp.]